MLSIYTKYKNNRLVAQSKTMMEISSYQKFLLTWMDSQQELPTVGVK
jgi:hypothetical protein